MKALSTTLRKPLRGPRTPLCSPLAALAIGALSLRTRGIYFIMVTLAFGEMLYFLFHDTTIGGGSPTG